MSIKLDTENMKGCQRLSRHVCMGAGENRSHARSRGCLRARAILISAPVRQPDAFTGLLRCKSAKNDHFSQENPNFIALLPER
jgi:hypothetical protein